MILTKRILFIVAILYSTLSLAQDSNECVSCHDKLEHSLAHMASSDQRHKAQVSQSAVNQNCISCHGASAKHTNRPKKFAPTIAFGGDSATPASEQNQSCLSCHQASATHWQASVHDNEGLSCSSCHVSHKTRDPVLQRENQVAVCTDCHTRIRSQLHLPSRHPIAENETVCGDCHTPHGSLTEFQLTKTSINETCFSCHAEKRGPFLFEHTPASENCSHCHTPHGSINQSLLNARTPFLCQQCHSVAFHPSVAQSGNGLPSRQASASLLGKNCMNCHNQVHGSNHPSGPSLTR